MSWSRKCAGTKINSTCCDHRCLSTPSCDGSKGGSGWGGFCHGNPRSSSRGGIQVKPLKQGGCRWSLFCIIQSSPERPQVHVAILCSCVPVCGHDGLEPGDGRQSIHPRLIQPGQQQCGRRPPGAALHRAQRVLGRTPFLPGRQGNGILLFFWVLAGPPPSPREHHLLSGRKCQEIQAPKTEEIRRTTHAEKRWPFRWEGLSMYEPHVPHKH